MNGRAWVVEELEARLLLASSAFFPVHTDYGTGTQPYSVAAGDFNADGKPDLAVANYGNNTVSVLINKGNGTFFAKVDYATATHPEYVAAGDFSGDGKPDLAVACVGSNGVSVLINNGNGTFATHLDYATANLPYSLAVADFNGDGHPDIAAGCGSYAASVLINNGSGTFATRVNYTSAYAWTGIAAADFNGDGHPDLAMSDYWDNELGVRMNNGNGTFGAESDIAAGNGPESVAAGDFNGDGHPDLAVANSTGNTVGVLLNAGSGTFGAETDYATGQQPNSVAAADLNADGRPELVTANESSSTVSVLMGNADGTFATHVDFATGATPLQAVAADFNADGKVDIAAANWYDNTASVLLGDGTASYWGPLITFDTFNQDAPYNQYCPNDPTGLRSYTGCTATAIAQVLYYWQFPHTISFTWAADHYTSNGANGSIQIDGDWSLRNFPTFAQLNAALASIPYDFSASSEAWLSFAVGIKLRADYSGGASGTLAGADASNFVAFGFQSAQESFTWDAATTQAVALSIEAGEPAVLMLSSPTEGHTIVADGYASDGAFHLNMGWGGLGDGWYSLPSFSAGGVQFTGITEAVYDIVARPVVVTTASPLVYHQAASWAAVDSGVTVGAAGATIVAATVSISGNYDSGKDLLTFTNQNGITGSWSASTGTMTLSGTATVAQYQAALRSVLYGNGSATASALQRTFTFAASDGTAWSLAATRAGNFIPDAAAVVTTTASPLGYLQAAGWTAVDPGATIADSDSATLYGAWVWISGNYDSGKDVLAFTDQNGIFGSWSASTGILTMSGNATVAQYQAAIDSVLYRNASATASALTRTFSFKVTDGILNSNAATRDGSFTPDAAPVATTTGTVLSYTQAGGPAAVDPGFTASDSDSANLASAAVWISGNFAAGQDVLSFTNQNGITGSYNASTGILSLSGASSVANYQAAIRSVVYSDTSGAPSLLQRAISFRVNDGVFPSNTPTRAVDVAPDSAPVVSTTASPLGYFQANGWAAIDPGAGVTDSDNANLAGAWVWISGNFAGTQDVLGFVNQNGITGSYNTAAGILTLTGASSVANYQAALRSVAYANTGNPPSALQRTFSFRVNDGALDSNTATRLANFTADSVPVVTPSAAPMRYVVDDGWDVLDGGATVADSDSATLAGATVSITGNYVNGQDVLGFTNQNGITGSWNASTGVLTLSGASSVANYQAALHAVGYYWITTTGTPPARTVSFQVTDGLRSSAVATRTVNIMRVGTDLYEYNDASWVATPVTLNDSGAGTVANASIFAVVGSDTDWFRFTVPYGATGDVSVTVGNVGGGLKAHVGLYDSILGTLADQVPSLATLFGPKAQVDGSTANGTVTLNYSGVAAGTTYYIKVTGLTSTQGMYDLAVNAAMMSPDALESNNTSAAATNATTTLVSGSGACCYTSLSLHRSTDEDWFRIDTPANTDGNLVATVSHLTGGLQGLVWVYQQYSWGLLPMGIGVYASWTPGGAGAATIYNAQPNTTYYIRVDNFWAETGAYQLDVTLPLDQQAKDAYEPNDASWAARPLTLTGNAATVNSLTIHNTADQDWFSFMPTTNGNVTITISGVSAGLKAHVALYDSVLGTMSDQYGGVYTTLFGPKQVADASTANQTVTLSFSGLHAWTTYYVKVSGLTSTTGLYTFGVAFTPTGSAGDPLLLP